MYVRWDGWKFGTVRLVGLASYYHHHNCRAVVFRPLRPPAGACVYAFGKANHFDRGSGRRMLVVLVDDCSIF